MKRTFFFLILNCLIAQQALAASAEDLFHQGQIFASQKAYDKAQEAYLQALVEDPQFERAHISLALIYSLKKEYAKALYQLDKALKINPKNPLPHKVKGLIYRDQKKPSKAIQALQNYLASVPPEQLKEKDRTEIEALISQLQKEIASASPEGVQ